MRRHGHLQGAAMEPFVRLACCVSWRSKFSAGRDEWNRELEDGVSATRRNLTGAESEAWTRRRPVWRGNPTMAGTPDRHPVTHAGKSGEAAGKETRFALIGIAPQAIGTGQITATDGPQSGVERSLPRYRVSRRRPATGRHFDGFHPKRLDASVKSTEGTQCVWYSNVGHMSCCCRPRSGAPQGGRLPPYDSSVRRTCERSD